MKKNYTFNGYYNKIDLSDLDEEITFVEKGSPCGELLRRYWQPVILSEELGELPKLVKILDEELVIFRDKSSQVGLLDKHCSHRGASLEYGIVADCGLICSYHGWHFDIDGTLLKAGSEPCKSPVHKRVKHGAYQTYEYEGIIFAYLGPPEKTPEFPLYDTQTNNDLLKVPFTIETPCNWLQVYENTQDPIHVIHLHARSSGVQFGVASGVDQIIEYDNTPLGMINIQTRLIDDHVWTRTTESILPNGNQTGAIWEEAESEKFFQRTLMLRWVVPLDNTSTKTIGWRYFSKELDPRSQGDASNVGVEKIDFIGQTKNERSYEDSQRQPGDYEAQVSQRPVAVHKMENLASSDTGVAKLRNLVRTHVRNLADGGEIKHPKKNEFGHISTYTQDTVIKAQLDELQQRKFSKNLIKNVKENSHFSPEVRRQKAEESSREFIKELS